MKVGVCCRGVTERRSGWVRWEGGGKRGWGEREWGEREWGEKEEGEKEGRERGWMNGFDASRTLTS